MQERGAGGVGEATTGAWVNNCVGYYNIGHFYRFLFYTFITTLYAVALICWRLTAVEFKTQGRQRVRRGRVARAPPASHQLTVHLARARARDTHARACAVHGQHGDVRARAGRA